MSKIVVIVGPTASGKSALATTVARQLNGEIVSADSMQIYRGLDVGTAKESAQIRKEIPHHMLDIVAPNENFSVSQYKLLVSRAIEKILSEDKTPVVVGGTGLYIDALLYPLTFGKADRDDVVRKMLEDEYLACGGEMMHKKLKAIDPKSALLLHPNDEKRIIRALEIFYVSGMTKTQSKDEIKKCAYDIVFVGLNCERSVLYNKIDNRVDEMFEKGLIDEIKSFEKFEDRFSWQSMQAIGYKEFLDYYKNENDNAKHNLDKTITNCTKEQLDEIKDKIKKHSRNYAKRQLTWFRKYDNLKWFDCISEIPQAVEYVISELKTY